MHSVVSTMTIDHVTITELPKNVDSRTRKSLLSTFERFTLEHRMAHLIILPREEDLAFESLGLLVALCNAVDKAGGVVGLVSCNPATTRVLRASGLERYFKCFSSVSAGVESLSTVTVSRDPETTVRCLSSRSSLSSRAFCGTNAHRDT